MNINNANVAITSAPSLIEQPVDNIANPLPVGCASIEIVRNSAEILYTSTTARVGFGAVVGAAFGAILTGPCGFGTIAPFLLGPPISVKVGAIAGTLGGSLGGGISRVVEPVIERAGEAVKSAASSAAVGCLNVIERAADCAAPSIQNTEEPVTVQPQKSVHTQDAQDLVVPYRIRRIVKNRDTNSHPIVTSDTQPYPFEASSEESDDEHCN